MTAQRKRASATSETTPPPARHDERERQLGAHIFSVSAGLVGVCLTVIGLFRVIVQSQHVDSIADNILAFDALIFLIACFFAYLALRSRHARARHYERIADVAFLAGLTLMVIVGAMIAYEVV